MDTDMSGAVECKKKKRNRGRRRPFAPPPKRSWKPGRRGGAKGRSRVLKRMRGSTSMEGSNGAATTPSSSPGGPSVTDPTPSDEDTLKPPPSSPVAEVADTNACAKARPPEETPDGVLEAHPRHHSLGQGGICPDALSWCPDRPSEMHPDASYTNPQLV
ncbi:uncharacterized protein LOC126927396 [Bombus affinis]|uniref:uncharacterized protein LOC126927396 n=1 Tax=Bombus affinis TaxID=309941 RepID=UPI0021B78647|nr:uncharacterized protein LOC126927396 [Bombus affinis]XP_050599512.1 uncharacterized protein LOC126927396 [Bombus affinis]XP_050599513.1 uncharacterized protein LOC126927396 [Bombus affinis]XP_050599515.1 uncharacterized protein LOC126927396 [Bombus affinis]XP_050599516.1 uncharacterized protein LOC126927396 [Bombus affinis]XP_050599517.1 uncharacterized protein LOC126927396 [Bombus affinis]XP_050599518.1 uncharacterized protein LOC126927396 [Bombus affinis]XP_050599519.1 uncharacterized p